MTCVKVMKKYFYFRRLKALLIKMETKSYQSHSPTLEIICLTGKSESIFIYFTFYMFIIFG